MRFDFDINWKKVKLGEILKIKSGMNQKKVETQNGKYNIYGTGGIIGKTNTPIYSKESVGIGRKGTIDKPFYFSEPFWTVDTLFYSEIKSHHVKFIYYLFQTINWKFYNQSTGVPSLTSSVIENISINIPSSLEEERKIANFLSEVDERIVTQKKIIDKYESLIYSIYNKLLSNETNEKLGNICEIKKGTQLNTDNFDLTGSYPVINGGINISGYTTSYNCKNMITISEGGNSCGFINYFKDEFWSGGHNYTLKKKTEFNYKYLYHYLKFKEKSIMSLRVGSGLPNIQKPALQNFSIYLPDISIQNKYACILDVILEKIKIEKGILTLYTKEKEYLLNKLFI